MSSGGALDGSRNPPVSGIALGQLKKDYMDSITDTLDLVPIAAWHGQGKRTGNFGAFLLACYDEDGDTFQAICKVCERMPFAALCG